ncbi:hypothetical protein GUITHDRAFT_163073 [Guillardia theta CCMP2712]|uniref:RING-type domain-containing protein n=1 Tax=Guillardia theta (strain CCMP2712) TaxID=905079 RepID=L1JBS1_GUITC|nr:hypothetical protein GUITHDRAFT_163073 [Guillardia theta CCMP2712]EKX45988.1 hypothetical protein GUITHDRAFT_163073 [Guillardia theta CCMP2712]|eukprot:XP_005832968.1 hypothetical protein GUITHDRAFT_163073 [Guillardia theta CCMP2712]
MSVLFERKLVPTDLMTFADANLILVFGFIIFFLWFLRLLRLNISVSTGQVVDEVVRLQTTSMTFQERGGLFGEIRMLWRTNMQQQLLRARRICSPIDVNELAIPFSVEKSSITVKLSARGPNINDALSGVTRVNFKYLDSAVEGARLTECTRLWRSEVPLRCNWIELRILYQENVVTHGRKKKRIFGRRYISVNQDRETHRSFEFEMEKIDTMHGSETIEVEPRNNQAPLFTDNHCCARFADRMDELGGFDIPFNCSVGLKILQGNVQTSELQLCPHSQHPDAQDGQETSPSPSANRSRARNAAANNEASSHANEEGGNGGDATFTLLIAAKALGLGEEMHESAAHRGQGKDAESVNLVLVVLQESKNASQDGSKTMNVMKQIILTNKAAYTSQEIFGCSESEDDGQEDCVICLSEPKDTTLLPCRHLCVCHSCFSRLELCPVCRSPFTAYLRQVKEGEGEGEGEEEEERVVCETADDNATEHARADNRDEAQPADDQHGRGRGRWTVSAATGSDRVRGTTAEVNSKDYESVLRYSAE